MKTFRRASAALGSLLMVLPGLVACSAPKPPAAIVPQVRAAEQSASANDAAQVVQLKSAVVVLPTPTFVPTALAWDGRGMPPDLPATPTSQPSATTIPTEIPPGRPDRAEAPWARPTVRSRLRSSPHGCRRRREQLQCSPVLRRSRRSRSRWSIRSRRHRQPCRHRRLHRSPFRSHRLPILKPRLQIPPRLLQIRTTRC